jgi:hypothetical protein
MFSVGEFDFHDPASGGMVTGAITRTMLNPKLIIRGNPFATSDDQIANVLNGLCEWKVPVRLYSTDGTAESLARVIATLNAELTCTSPSSTPGVNGAEPTNTLTDSLERDADETPATVFVMKKSDPVMPSRGDLTEKRLVMDATMTIRTVAYGASASPIDIVTGDTPETRVALYDMYAMSDDAAVDIPSPKPVPLKGELHTQLVLTVTGDLMVNVICAVCPLAAEIADYDTGMTGSGGPGVIATHTVSLVGRFRVLATLSSDVDHTIVGLGFGGVGVANGEAELYDLGEFVSGGASTLSVHVNAGAAALTHLILVPVDISCVSAWGLPEVDSITFAYNANDQPAYTIGNGLIVPPTPSKLLVVVDPPTVNFTVDLSYVPLWWGWAY